MKKKLLGSNIEPKCRYCRFGTRVVESDTVLCPKKGVMDKNEYCKKFRYDALKRKPQTQAPTEVLTFTESDFSLD